MLKPTSAELPFVVIGDDTEAPSSVPARKARKRPKGRGAAANDSAADAVRFALPAQCVIQDVRALHQQLAPMVDDARPLTLDVQEVRKIDTAGIQVLAAFVADRRRRGLSVAWGGASESLGQAAAVLGLRALLDLPTDGEQR